MSLPRVSIVTPALAGANNGNWHTAARWQRYLSPMAQVDITSAWQGQPVDALIALHARRSADSIDRFRLAHPDRPLALVLTGTDLYRDLPAGDAAAARSLACADRIVVLQQEALRLLPEAARGKARVIVQSAPRLVRRDQARGHCEFVAVGHLRDVKDPLTLMRAACALPDRPAMGIVHIGNPLDEALGREAERTMAACPRYRWLGGLPPGTTRRWIARGRALVHMSRMEGGANVVIEAVRSDVPVLASRIDGNVGLLGAGYDGYFEAGDAAALAQLMVRFASEAAFAARLAQQCAALAPGFAPSVEAARVRALLADLSRQCTTDPRTSP
ncbi:selenoneine biosynthesis selenosugar synthase SenB [Piscinibacter sp. XHJ-5]|uniref:selenoneine biosynthesis selenosugar synthase SenB n=1 Tax=Piscinibacter sp. XHJ-5 TaxID=3037797 RepID=UPI0024532F85|nr:selenoneine biosynthesis selenosugar synthase SenB [Piscinibacter sp. XHJ-5]